MVKYYTFYLCNVICMVNIGQKYVNSKSISRILQFALAVCVIVKFTMLTNIISLKIFED